MDGHTTEWIFGILIGINTLCIGGTFSFIIATVQRLTKVETLLDLVSKNYSQALHSPHTPELDAYLEKLHRTYVDRHYELSIEEWEGLKKECDKLIEDAEEPKGSKAMAAFLSALSEHKLSVFKSTTK